METTNYLDTVKTTAILKQSLETRSEKKDGRYDESRVLMVQEVQDYNEQESVETE